jgi:hypothetical protein
MLLNGFRFSPDLIGIESQGKYHDPHNCYDFKGLAYEVDARRLVLIWEKGRGAAHSAFLRMG